MSDGGALLAAILDSPEDDGLRLVYADWLEEHGEANRAEFIRVQIDLARLPTTSPRYPELRVREAELLLAHERAWLGDWADRLVHWEFHRGLLRDVKLLPEPFIRDGLDLFARHPVERVALVDERGESLGEEAVRAVCAAPAMGRVRALDTPGCRPDEPMGGMYGGEVQTSLWLSVLAAARHVSRLEELSFAGHTRSGRGHVDIHAWQAFCRAPHLRSIRRLDLSDAYTNDPPTAFPALVVELAQAVFAPNLRALSLDGCALTDEAVGLLANAGRLSGLEELGLAGCELVRTVGLQAILGPGGPARLHSLGAPYGPDLALLASSPAVERLRSLRLSGLASGGVAQDWGDGTARPLGRRVAPDEWDNLFRSDRLRNLTRLSVSANTAIPAEAVAALLQTTCIKNLRELHFRCDLGSADCFAPLLSRQADGATLLASLALPSADGIGPLLRDWPGLAGLTALSVTDLRMRPTPRELLSSPHFSCRLARLDLTGACRAADEVEMLANNPALRGLRWLGFGYNDLTWEKMAALLGSPSLRCLESLHLGSEWEDQEQPGGVTEALKALAGASAWPRLRDVVVGSETAEGGIKALTQRFGPRLRVWCDY